jgi:hypothetical protein
VKFTEQKQPFKIFVLTVQYNAQYKGRFQGKTADPTHAGERKSSIGILDFQFFFIFL